MPILVGFCLLLISTTVQTIEELKLVHVVFTHKTHAPVEDRQNGPKVEIQPNLTYAYFSEVPEDMFNENKLNMFNLGVYLRQRYGDFLGEIYTENVTTLVTNQFVTSMMSGSLVNAGLWPPASIQRWHDDLPWQPIPTVYEELKKDYLLMGNLCPNFLSDTASVLESDSMKEQVSVYKPLFDELNQRTGLTIDQPSEIEGLYITLETMADANQSLPAWSADIFPDGQMYFATLLSYNLSSITKLQKRLNGGALLKKIIDDSVAHLAGNISNDHKIMMYSGDERNVAGILQNLNLWSPHIPSEGAAVIFEVYEINKDDGYSVKVLYYTGVDGEMINLTLSECTELCPLTNFSDILSDVLPTNAKTLCGWNVSGDIEEENSPVENSSPNRENSESLLVFLHVVYIWRVLT
ncbi:venom acid phosphatase Acph-1 [Orussus abietinus]|uniref:venom acid phosphatase Acph-1 n=1 Tax=Orussus abietinus TaxID=222816 RepID=UPI00062697E6|nr:venom acid phosphatase Acph-1 [Orussus abietinus]